MATFNEIFNQRFGKDLPKFNPITNVNVEARMSNDQRAFRLAAILAADAEYKKNQAKQQGGPVPTNLTGKAGDNEQVISDNSGFSITNPLKAAGSGLLDVATTGLDLISRPAYSVFEGMRRGAEVYSDTDGFMESPDTIGKALIGAGEGLWEGLSGQKKTGFGEVVEEVVPDAPLNLKRALGFVGEIGLDPLNYVGVGLAGKAGKGVKGVDEIKALYKGIARQAADDIGMTRFLDKKVATSVVDDLGRKISPNLPQAKTYLDDVVDKAFDDTVLELEKGLAGGRILGGELLPATVSTKVTDSMRNLYYKDFDAGFATLLRHASGEAPLTSKQLQTLFNGKLKNFEKTILDTYAAETKKRFGSLEDLFTYRKTKELSPLRQDEILERAAVKFKSESDKIFTQLQDDIFKKLEGEFYNAPAIKVLGRDVASFDRIGRNYAKLREAKFSGKASKGLSYGKTFPGRTALMNQRLRSVGIKKYEEFHQEVKKVAQTLTKDERKQIHKAILNGTDFTDPRLQTAKEFVQEQYALMWNEEIAAGVHKLDPNKPFHNFADNYVYLYHRKNKGNAVNELRKRLKTSVRESQHLPDDALDLAKQKGLAPVEDAFEALLLRQIKSNRDLSRSLFMEDLLDHYGIKANRLSDNSARDLVKIGDQLPDHLRRQLGKGDQWYLPSDIKTIYDDYVDIISLGSSEEAAALLKVYDKLTRMFKASATLPYPGFHIRNSLGDIFMSSLDGVKFRDYAILNRARLEARAGKEALIHGFGDEAFDYNTVHDLFLKNAASGNFMSVDLGRTDELIAQVSPNRALDAVRRGSEYRENFFREAHFIRALKDEYPAALRKARNKEVALRNAAEAATYRVNKSLFDYGALTKIERNVLRRAIPFYTYSRKSMPTLMEAMLLNPKNLSRANRWLIDEEARGTSTNFNDMLVPQYAREIGYMQLTDEAEPWTLGAGFLPTSVARDNLNFSSPQGFGQNILQNLNPYLKMPAELAFNRTAFDNREITSTSDYLVGAMAPPVGPIADLSNLAGGPNLSNIPGLGRVTGETSKDPAEVLLSNRFLLGLPFDKIKENQQAAALYTMTADVKRELSKVDDKIKDNGLSIYVSQRKEGTSFRVRDDETGQVLFESLDAKATADFALKANNAKSRFRNG